MSNSRYLDKEREQWWVDAKEVLKPRYQFNRQRHNLAMLNHYNVATTFVKLETGHCYECGMTTSHAPDCKTVYEPLNIDIKGIDIIESGVYDRSTN